MYEGVSSNTKKDRPQSHFEFRKNQLEEEVSSNQSLISRLSASIQKIKPFPPIDSISDKKVTVSPTCFLEDVGEKITRLNSNNNTLRQILEHLDSII